MIRPSVLRCSRAEVKDEHGMDIVRVRKRESEEVVHCEFYAMYRLSIPITCGGWERSSLE